MTRSAEPTLPALPTGRPRRQRPMRARVYLTLGRVSNLPTVWTDVLAGVALAGAPLAPGRIAALATAGSLLYVGGMFLNDAFDRLHDARERPERPIPAGWIGAREVAVAGAALLAVGVSIVAAVALAAQGAGGARAVAAAALLAGAIVLYDAWHKGNPLAPAIMGGCRALLVLTAGLAASGRATAAVAAGALLLGGYVTLLTVVARRETRGRPLPIARLIAGISLVDGLLVAAAGHPVLGLVAGSSGFAATLATQRWVRGT